jgi:Arc/MetJ-type ribon-helix-helix transcriptional regulator
MAGHTGNSTGDEEFSPPIQVRLTRRQWEFVTGEVKRGRWSTMSEGVRAGMYAIMKSEGKA